MTKYPRAKRARSVIMHGCLAELRKYSLGCLFLLVYYARPLQHWTYTTDHTIVSEANGYVLTIRNGSKKPRTAVWSNFIVPVMGITKAQMWTFVPYSGEPKNPTYQVDGKFKYLLERKPLD